ncbi:MAG: GntR family transcriptional regulator [Thermoanaerobaculia bacterium]|nr:GntR family transcriptional regulator [Thermoanaerobaculia bacterium]
MIHINPSNAQPIWSQIEEGVRQLVARGVLLPASSVPSVRELAKELRVNPATISKAYRRLTDEGILEVRRGEGTFVSTSPPSLSNDDRQKRLTHAASNYAAVAITLGAAASEAIDCLQQAYSEIDEVSR